MRLIDADALKEKAWDADTRCGYVQVVDVGDIDNAPTIEPERKVGKWIFYETENERYDDIKCPFCKKTYTVDAYRIDDIGFTAEDLKFCPNCGEKMEVPEDIPMEYFESGGR